MSAAYTVERVPLPVGTRSTRTNPVAAVMRALEVGQSFVVPLDDPNWRAGLIGNENQRGHAHYVAAPVPRGRRVYRDR